MPLREVDGEIVSSSRIRSLIAAGEVGRAARAAGRPVRAARRPSSPATAAAATLGFPTANLVPAERRRLPGPRRLRVPGERRARRPSTSACGRRSAAAARELIEAFLIDFDGDLYGTELRLRFLERLRGERRFETRRGADRGDARRRRARPAIGRRLLPFAAVHDPHQ